MKVMTDYCNHTDHCKVHYVVLAIVQLLSHTYKRAVYMDAKVRGESRNQGVATVELGCDQCWADGKLLNDMISV